VPQALALCEDGDVNGAPFYVMSYVDGAVLRSHADLEGVDAGGRERLARSMVAVLADLHGVDVEAAGLTGFGRPDGFMARQVRRWATQLDGSRSRDLPGIEELRDALAATVPTPPDGTPYPAAVVHGDYRLDNLVVARVDDPQVVADPSGWPVRAVLDWEMATIGDPLADLGLLLAYWDGLGGSQSVGDNPVAEAIGPRAGFPQGERLVAWYAERGGADLSALPWYVAFGFFKIAVILEGIHYRYAQGQTVGAGFDRIGDIVPVLVTLGRDALHP
jgi:aminoglycoside phosphotransferase (APT) family kinase protein